MSTTEREDPIWQAAWQWVLREHEAALSPSERAEMLAWLRADPLHMTRYEEAARMRLLASLLPSSGAGAPGPSEAD